MHTEHYLHKPPVPLIGPEPRLDPCAAFRVCTHTHITMCIHTHHHEHQTHITMHTNTPLHTNTQCTYTDFTMLHTQHKQTQILHSTWKAKTKKRSIFSFWYFVPRTKTAFRTQRLQESIQNTEAPFATMKLSKLNASNDCLLNVLNSEEPLLCPPPYPTQASVCNPFCSEASTPSTSHTKALLGAWLCSFLLFLLN